MGEMRKGKEPNRQKKMFNSKWPIQELSKPAPIGNKRWCGAWKRATRTKGSDERLERDERENTHEAFFFPPRRFCCAWQTAARFLKDHRQGRQRWFGADHGRRVAGDELRRLDPRRLPADGRHGAALPRRPGRQFGRARIPRLPRSAQHLRRRRRRRRRRRWRRRRHLRLHGESTDLSLSTSQVALALIASETSEKYTSLLSWCG